MWDEIQIFYSDAFEIAEALIKREVTLDHLMSVPVFATKANNVEVAVWGYCKRHTAFRHYMEIYPNGIYSEEIKIEDCKAWQKAESYDIIDSYTGYLCEFPDGRFVSEAQDRIRQLKKFGGSGVVVGIPSPEWSQEELIWYESEKTNTIESYLRYLDQYPGGRYINEARLRIEELKEQIVCELEQNRNSYSLNYLKALGITPDDLTGRIRDSKGQVRDEVLKSWNRLPKHEPVGDAPERIPEGVEVYFWGIPGAGKTCAIASILRDALATGNIEPRAEESTQYFNYLSNIFISSLDEPAVPLPTATSSDAIQYLPLSYIDRSINTRRHNISIFNIPGEVFECFSAEIMGRTFKSGQQQRIYEQLKQYLQNKDNPKYHIFVLDSNPLIGIDQLRFLHNAVIYFGDKRFFNKTTRGISVLVTKCDVLSTDRSKWVDYSIRMLIDKYSAFVDKLKRIVTDLHINNGEIPVIPFSIGEVFFQNLCLYDSESSKVFLELVMKIAKDEF